MKRCILITVAGACAGAGAPAGAQLDDLGGRLRSIEQGHEDLSPQAESFRVYPVDLRVPEGFFGLYEIVDAPGLLARRSGAVTAVFERSVYDEDSSVGIPPGTVFYVGDLPVDLASPGVLSALDGRREAPENWNYVDSAATTAVAGRVLGQRVDLRVPESADMTAAPPAADESIWSSEAARRRRLGEIMRGAAWRLRELEAQAAECAEGASEASDMPGG